MGRPAGPPRPGLLSGPWSGSGSAPRDQFSDEVRRDGTRRGLLEDKIGRERLPQATELLKPVAQLGARERVDPCLDQRHAADDVAVLRELLDDPQDRRLHKRLSLRLGQCHHFLCEATGALWLLLHLLGKATWPRHIREPLGRLLLEHFECAAEGICHLHGLWLKLLVQCVPLLLVVRQIHLRAPALREVLDDALQVLVQLSIECVICSDGSTQRLLRRAEGNKVDPDERVEEARCQALVAQGGVSKVQRELSCGKVGKVDETGERQYVGFAVQMALDHSPQTVIDHTVGSHV
mmetsp:Transcript_85853/g.257198  ORF Transcript_85853/g.257198 Transcript_85853/m.257198 type:complete len:293 (+) Transcript_85853:1350-2228(+)